MKKTLAIVLALILTLALTLPASAATLKIGIAQFAVHGSLDNIREGFLQGLAQEGFVDGENIAVTVQNAQADMGQANAIASAFVSNRFDLICAIATPMAVVSANTADGAVPVIYAAVTSPIEAGLADENERTALNVTGTSDQPPIAQQLALIRALQPDAKTVGLLYTVGEVNSQVLARQYRELAAEYGFEIAESTVTAGSEIPLALPGIVQKADCLSMLLDNTVVQYLDLVLDAADEASIPVYGSEIEQVTKGCAASAGIDYIALGRETGMLAARVLKGEPASAIPYVTATEATLYVNPDVLSRLNITLPEELAGKVIDASAK
ncbi:MAG: ABC transporter substrate-binding protein [Christensenellales bacterium]|jgi:putative ABC transport system substrate-binding protein